MEQFEKMIANRDTALANNARTNAEVIARGDYPLAYRNMCRALEKRFDIGLLRWRRGETPVADLEAVLAKSQEMRAAITDWHLDDETLNGKGYAWNLVRITSYLLNQPVALPEERLVGIREDLSQYADVALDYRILDVLEGRERADDLSALFERLASKKRQMLAVDTYRTYFDLLDAGSDPERTEALVRMAEANYKKRGRDAFYGGGPTYMGGGPDNPYVVDFMLAAILKKIGWAGNTIHQWKWSHS